MQLESLALYSRTGERKVIPFKLGALNVITGQSKTGKTVLVKLIDYCLGRRDVPTSAGGVERALVWVGAIWQFDDGNRAFVGRPVPPIKTATTTEAMLILGDGTLTAPDFEALNVNTNTGTMRLELGARLGLTESEIAPPVGALRNPTRTNLGHAALLCIQNQDEISSSSRIFHRSGQPGIDNALRDTIPYFLGATPADQALLKSMLRQENRRLQRLERELKDAQDVAQDLDDDLRNLLAEATEAGLTERLEGDNQLDRSALILHLHAASRDLAAAVEDEPAIAQQDNRRREQNELALAEDALDQLLQQRALLLEESEGGNAYADAIDLQVGRLASLDLLALASNHAEGTPAGSTCPICGSADTATDATATQMREALDHLRNRLERTRSANPAKSATLDDLNARIAIAQAQVRSARQLLEATFATDSTVGRETNRRRDFIRGRIDATLARTPQTDDNQLARMRERIELSRQAVETLQLQLSDDDTRERLNSLMLAVGRDLTDYARTLELEHSERDVRIDLVRLTVIADVDDVPVPLNRIGSAENWIGYHIASHLALHQSFIRHERPVPRLLVIDQPSQGHYPSEMAKRTGRADTDADELAVRRLYELMNDFTVTNGGQFQVITVDHADIDQPWFQTAITDRWRGEGNALIPTHWLTAN